MTEVVYATASVVTFHDGAKVRVSVDEPWDAADPFVKANPGLFRSDVDRPQRSVETATAAPGERRDVKRPAKKAAAVKSDG